MSLLMYNQGMAYPARPWKSSDIRAMNYFSSLKERDTRHPSYRDIGAKTGISFTRVNALLNRRGGLPTLQEFISLCIYFGQNPADVIRRITAPAQNKTVEFSALSEADQKDMRNVSSLLSKAKTIVDRHIIKKRGQATTASKKQSNQHWVLMANHDPNRDLEADTPDD